MILNADNSEYFNTNIQNNKIIGNKCKTYTLKTAKLLERNQDITKWKGILYS